GQIYAEFCALFLEMQRFAPALIHHYFPTLSNVVDVETILKRDCPADELFEGSKLPGAEFPTPVDQPASSMNDLSFGDPWKAPSLQRAKVQPLRFRYHRLRARLAARQGNDVRCVLQNISAYRTAPDHLADDSKADVDEALVRLAERLAKG